MWVVLMESERNLYPHANPARRSVTDERLDKRSGGVAFSAEDREDASTDSSLQAVYDEIEAERMVRCAQESTNTSELFASDEESIAPSYKKSMK
jgi:hypothetical protein